MKTMKVIVSRKNNVSRSVKLLFVEGRISIFFDIVSVFHLQKNSGNSGRVVNGTRLFGSFN